MIYEMIKRNPEGTSLHPVDTYTSEQYAHSHYGLYLEDELTPNSKAGKQFIHNYRLHAQAPHDIEQALAYDVYCPKCGRLMKQIGRSRSYHELGLYTCKHCNEN